jgi:C-terminal processing protease CtpA/Prc
MEGQSLQEVIKGLLRYLGENNYAFESQGDRLRRVSIFPTGAMDVAIRPGNEGLETEKFKTEGPKRVDVIEVTNVIEGSQAESLGLQKGDFIIEYDGRKMGRASQLVMETKKKKPHETVELRAVREGNPMRFFVSGGFIGIQIKTIKVFEKSFNY